MISSLIVIMSVLLLLWEASFAQDRTIRRQDAPARAESGTERRVALVIGNGAYKSAPLRNPTHDAKIMASALREMGFEVSEKPNLNYQGMNEAITAFGEKLLQGGVGLFYYAGHGIQIEGKNYLIPVGEEISHEKQVKYKAVDAGQVLAEMANAKNRMNIVILDACRNNPFERSFRTASQGLAHMEAPTGTLVAYATSPGKTAEDGGGDNSIYTSELVRQMKTPGLSLEDVFKQVRRAVRKKTSDRQVPWEVTSLEGVFYFRMTFEPGAGASPSASGTGEERAKLEEELRKTQAERDAAERRARELEEKRKTEELEQKIAEERRKKDEADRRLRAEEEKASVPQKAQPAPASAYGQEVGREGVYIAYANGIVKDTKTGLEWVAGPDKVMSWDEAKAWVESLNIGGGGWRMPTVEELEGLYQEGKGARNMTPLLKTTGWWVWSGELKDSSAAWYFFFGFLGRLWHLRDYSFDGRAFAVRSRSSG
jgi:uncharacterized caspase-like protein